MKLLRYGERGRERPGLLDAAGEIRCLAAHCPDIDPDFLADAAAIARLGALDPVRLPLVAPGVRIGAPVARIGKIVGIGLNYRDHALESGANIPSEPILFLKAVTSLSGPNDSIVLPAGSEHTDWEVELGAVIAKRASCVSREDALDHIAGYCVAHDVSERHHQLERGGQWTKGKSHDTFCPLGPWLVTADEVSNPQALSIWCEVDGVRLQDSSTSDMIFAMDEIVSYVSRFMTLLPGDLLITGTPAGVGLGQRPPRYLRAGSRVRLGIDGLGVQEQVVRESFGGAEA